MGRSTSRFLPAMWYILGKELILSILCAYAVCIRWVGDQDPTFDGLQDALRNMFHSAWRNYVNFGSDIGGYRTGPGPLGRTKELFLRWAQLGAFVPLMENGGNKEHRPWEFDSTNETLNIYRKFVHIHTEVREQD
jgi:alpha-glucosidase